jgi:signal transduction histidine kinase
MHLGSKLALACAFVAGVSAAGAAICAVALRDDLLAERDRRWRRALAVAATGAAADRVGAADRSDRRTSLPPSGWLGLGAGSAAGLAISLGLTAWFAGRASARIRRLTASVRALARGDYAVRFEDSGRDEIGDVGRAFNETARQIADRQAALDRRESELRARIDERSAELKDAQEQRIQGRAAAAASDLGAGFAHEINNPLAGILGMAQYLIARVDADAPERGPIQAIEAKAKRIKLMVWDLLERTQAQAADRIDVNDLVTRALGQVAGEIVSRRIVLEPRLADGLPRIRGEADEIAQALADLLRRVMAQAPAGGRVCVTTSAPEDRTVEIVVFDTAPSGLGGEAAGLGGVDEIVRRHNGRFRVEPSASGTTFRLTFPISAAVGAIATSG